MSRRLDRWHRERAADLPRVVVCRGGDCGSRSKHPRFDHQAQLARLRGALDGLRATVTVSRCLDACDRSNVVVVQPGRLGRADGDEPVWIGEVLDEATTDAIVEWVGADDLRSEPPAPVPDHRFEPTRQSRQALSARGTVRRTRSR